MKKNNRANRNNRNWLKIFLIYNLVNIFIGLIFYRIVPTILNYPPDSINNEFQRALNNGQTYTSQYIIIIALVTIIENIFLYINLKRIYKLQTKIDISKNSDKVNLYQQLVKQALNLPYKLYAFQSIVPTILIGIVFAMLNGQIGIIIKCGIMYGTMCTLMSNVSYVFSKRTFKNILIEINERQDSMIDENFDLVEIAKRRGIKSNILMFTIPLFLVSTLFTGLIGYTRLTQENGNYIADVYREILNNSYETINGNITFNSLTEALGRISLKNKEDIYFIINPNGKVITSDNSELSEFFVRYIEDKSEFQNNRVYEFYGIDVEGIIKKIDSAQGEWIIGIRYGVLSSTALLFLVTGLLVLLAINLLLVYYSSKAIADDIKLVSDNLALISKRNSIDFNYRLPITSKDEISDLVKEFNKIQKLTNKHLVQIEENQETIKNQAKFAIIGKLARTEWHMTLIILQVQ